MKMFDPNAGMIFTDNQYLIADGAERQAVINPATLAQEGAIALCTE